MVYPEGADTLPLGVEEVMRQRTILVNEAREAGFEKIKITFKRLTGREVELTIALSN